MKDFLVVLFLVLFVIAFVAIIAVHIYVMVTYGNVPASELQNLPAWVLFFLFGS